MRFWTLLVVLELLTFSAADITVVNQKYEGITVAFSPSLHSSMAEITIHLVQAMMRSASQVMFAATRGRVYFGNVKFIIPLTWAHLNFTITTTERFEESVIRIDKQSKVYLGQPYTVQPGLCGDPGRYIHLSPEYLTDTAQAALWGPPDKALVKEWARVRWGVFEEYGYPDDPISPLVYCHPGQGGKPVPRLNYCAHHTPKWPLTGRCCQSYNTTSGDCSLHHLQGTTFTAHYYGNTRVGFCGPASSFKHLVYHHNEVAPTRHNVMCGGNSLWHVLSRHKDFSHPPSDLRTPPTNTAPTFTLALQEATKYILVFDFTGSLSCINRTLQAAYSWILHQLSSRSYLGIIKITDTGLSTVDLTLLTDTDIRRSLVLWLGDGYIHGGTSNKVNVLNITVKADHTDNSRLSTIFYKIKSMVGNGTSGSLTNVVLVLVTGGRRKTTSDDLLIIETEIFTTFDDLASESTTSETGESTTSDETETEDTETTTLESLVATEVRGENTATLDELLDSGLHLVTIALEKMADKRFESRAERTFTVLDCDNGDKLEGAFQSVLDYQPIDLAKIRLKVDQWSLKESFSNVTVEKSFTVAQDMGKNLVFRMYKDCADDFVYGPRLETPHGTLLKTPMYHDGSTYIPLAEPGIWKWRLRFYPNNSACHYVYASVFSQRRYGDPIVARAWGSGGKLVKVYNTPVAIYAEVKQANNPVVNATVRARVRLPGDRELEMMLLDDGKLGDNQAKDGIYSRYLTTYTFLGRYYVKVKVSGNKSTYVNDQCLTCATLQAPFRGQRRCCGGEVPLDCKRAARAGTFTMTISTFWFQVVELPDPGNMYPPMRVRDLRAALSVPYVDSVVRADSEAEDEMLPAELPKITLTWTATGDDYDNGTVLGYEVRFSSNHTSLLRNFDNDCQNPVLLSLPESQKMRHLLLEAGRSLTLELEREIEIDKLYYVALVAFDKKNWKSSLSNVAAFYYATASELSQEPLSDWQISLIVIFILIFLADLGGAVFYYLERVYGGGTRPLSLTPQVVVATAPL